MEINGVEMDEKVEIDGGEDITGRWTESWWGRYSVNKQTNMKLSSSIGFVFTVELRNVSEVKMCHRLF